jgi:hypothetical protein
MSQLHIMNDENDVPPSAIESSQEVERCGWSSGSAGSNPSREERPSEPFFFAKAAVWHLNSGFQTWEPTKQHTSDKQHRTLRTGTRARSHDRPAARVVSDRIASAACGDSGTQGAHRGWEGGEGGEWGGAPRAGAKPGGSGSPVQCEAWRERYARRVRHGCPPQRGARPPAVRSGPEGSEGWVGKAWPVPGGRKGRALPIRRGPLLLWSPERPPGAAGGPRCGAARPPRARRHLHGRRRPGQPPQIGVREGLPLGRAPLASFAMLCYVPALSSSAATPCTPWPRICCRTRRLYTPREAARRAPRAPRSGAGAAVPCLARSPVAACARAAGSAACLGEALGGVAAACHPAWCPGPPVVPPCRRLPPRVRGAWLRAVTG